MIKNDKLWNGFLGFVDFKHKRDAKDAVKDLNGEKLRGARIRLEMSDGPGNRKSGTSYEETAAFSTMREERGFNPRVILKSGFHGLQITIFSSLRDHIVQNMEWLYRIWRKNSGYLTVLILFILGF